MQKIFFCAMLFALAVVATPIGAAAFKAGEHYTIVNERSTSKPLVQEFFSYGCGACNAFDPVFTQARNALGERADFEYVPVDFGGGFWTPTQDLFLVLEAMGRREELHHDAFDYFFGDQPHPKTAASVDSFLVRHGVAAGQSEKLLGTFAVRLNEKRYDLLTKQFRISSTPTVIVNGRYQVERSAVHSSEEFAQLVEYLLQNP